MLVWGATFYLTGIPVAFALEALPATVASHPAFPSVPLLIALWPIVVTAILAGVCILMCAVLGEWALSHAGRAAEQPDAADGAGELERRR
ncbi:MAG TPA: hypothetical protein VKJ47_17105 [Candidatus Binatia bacterium]|nr:hypothetical protein [Candidatus Binatia bacterium]